MYLFQIPVKDSTIYEAFPTQNTGYDEILEVGKTSNDVGVEKIFKARALLQFDIAPLSSSISSGQIPASASYQIKLYLARADDLVPDVTLECIQVSRSWDEGVGYKIQSTLLDPNGVTWLSRMSASLWSVSGSETIGSAVTSSFNTDESYVAFDITSFVSSWISGSTPNNGVLVKIPDSYEIRNDIWSIFKFFSKQTHTIYQPQLIVKWNDQVYSTGSLSASSATSPMSIVCENMQAKYRQNETVRINFFSRLKYPLKGFDTMFTNWNVNQALPATSYFSIVDELSSTIIIPFSNESRISADSNGSYIKFKTQHMYPLRYYRLLLKTVIGTDEIIYDTNNIFSIK